MVSHLLKKHLPIYRSLRFLLFACKYPYMDFLWEVNNHWFFGQFVRKILEIVFLDFSRKKDLCHYCCCYYSNNQNVIIYKMLFIHSAGDAEGFFFKNTHGFSAIISLISLNHMYTWFSNLCFNTSSIIFPSLKTVYYYLLFTIIIVLCYRVFFYWLKTYTNRNHKGKKT